MALALALALACRLYVKSFLFSLKNSYYFV